MAHRIKAINAYRPRIEQGNTVQKPELVRATSRSTGIAEGTLDIQYRPDATIGYGLNIPGVFSGTIINRENIGKTSDELIARWNEEHADDPVIVTD